MSPSTDTTDTGAWRAVLLVTFLLAAALRFVSLESGLWYDEIVTLVQSVRHPVQQILTEFPSQNTHPLYSVLAHGSIQAFGESAWALRLPAAIFGVASVMMAYVLGARLTTRVEAWAAAATLTASYHHIWFSQNARGYTLMGFLTLFSTYFLLRAGQTGRRADYVVYGLSCAAGIYAHLTMAFVVAGHALVMLGGRVVGWRPALQQPLSPLLLAWTGAGALSAAAYAPYAAGLLAILGTDPPPGREAVATASWALGEALRSLLSGAGVPAALVGSVLAAFGAVSLWRRQPLAYALLMMPGVVTGLAVVAFGQPIRPRFFFFLSGAAAIFVGRGIGTAAQALAPARVMGWPASCTAATVACTLALVAVSAMALPLNYRVPKQDFAGALRFLGVAEAQGAQITASGMACLPLEIYYAKAEWRCLRSIDDWDAVRASARRVLVVHAVAGSVGDPKVADRLRRDCPVVRRFAGTLGGGDLIVCEVPQETVPE